MPTNWTVDEPSKQAFSNVVSLECTFTNYSTIVTTSDTSNLLPGMEAKNASQSLVIVREGGIYRIDSITNSTTFVLSFPAIEGHRAPGETYVHTVEFWSFDFPFSIFFYWQSNMDGLAKGTGWSDAFSVEDYSKFKSVGERTSGSIQGSLPTYRRFIVNSNDMSSHIIPYMSNSTAYGGTLTCNTNTYISDKTRAYPHRLSVGDKINIYSNDERFNFNNIEVVSVIRTGDDKTGFTVNSEIDETITTTDGTNHIFGSYTVVESKNFTTSAITQGSDESTSWSLP